MNSQETQTCEINLPSLLPGVWEIGDADDDVGNVLGQFLWNVRQFRPGDGLEIFQCRRVNGTVAHG